MGVIVFKKLDRNELEGKYQNSVILAICPIEDQIKVVCASLLRPIFASLSHANERVHLHCEKISLKLNSIAKEMLVFFKRPW